MNTAVDLHTEVLHRFVFELRYEFGQLYWDCAGKVARQITQEEGWDLEAIDANNCRLGRHDQNIAFNFGPKRLDMVQTQSTEVTNLLTANEFGAKAELLADEVIKGLDLSVFTRAGFRTWRLYPTKTRKESHKLSRGLQLFRTDESLESDLGDVSEASHRLVVDRERHMLRVAVAPFEQSVDLPDSVIAAARSRARDASREQRQLMRDKLRANRIVKSFPHFGLLLDLDAYVEEPPIPDDLTIGSFVETAHADCTSIRKAVLASVE